MNDPRVLLQYDEIWKIAPEELLWVASLEDSVMRSLANVAEIEADEFKSSLIAAAHVSYHFTYDARYCVQRMSTRGLWRVVISRKT